MAVKLVIFDLDGTLLEPALDFDAIRAEIGLPPGATILEGLSALSDQERARANVILDRHEAKAANRSRLMPRAKELLEHLRRQQIKVAVLTRNSRASVDRACERHGLQFDGVVAREDNKPKPSPAGIHYLMNVCGAGPEETIVVGDFRFEIEAGAAAGCRSIALVPDRPADWVEQATWTAESLADVQRILEQVATED